MQDFYTACRTSLQALQRDTCFQKAGVIKPPSLSSGTRHRGRGYGGRFALWLSPGSQKSARVLVSCRLQGEPRSTARDLARGGFSLSVQGVYQVQSIMILPQVHLRKPCYDFYFL